MKRPAVSILMAIRTGSEFFGEVLASIQAQTRDDWELLVGVNGQSENSYVWGDVTYQAGDDKRVRLSCLSECQNKPQALNALSAQAEGKYTAICDVDDLWEPEKLALQLDFLAGHPEVSLVGTAAKYFGDLDDPLDVDSGPISFPMLLEKNHIVNSSVVMRDRPEWPDTDGLDDYPMWLEMAYREKLLHNIPGMLTQIRCHRNQWFAGPRDNSAEIRRRWQGETALCVIATRKYRESFLARMLKSADRYFLPGHPVRYHIFSDGDPAGQLRRVQRPWIWNKVPADPWPAPTLRRYHWMLDAGTPNRFPYYTAGRDRYIFYCDVDAEFVAPVGDEILGKGLVGTIHQGYAGKRAEEFSYERRKESAAYIPLGEGRFYYAGGFQGGRSECFETAMLEMRERIDADAKAGITATWHDESHWNRYLLDHAPEIALPGTFLCAETGREPGVKLISLDKNHDEMRDIITC